MRVRAFFAGFVCALLHVCVWLVGAVCGAAGVGVFVAASRSMGTVHLTMWLRFVR